MSFGEQKKIKDEQAICKAQKVNILKWDNAH